MITACEQNSTTECRGHDIDFQVLNSFEVMIAAQRRVGVDEGIRSMTAPREAIVHSPLEEHMRDVLLAAFDRLQREFGMDEMTAMKVVDRLLTLADAGERSYCVLVQKASLTAGKASSRTRSRNAPPPHPRVQRR